MDLRFKSPFTAIVAGPTACGKTHFIIRFIKHLSLICDTEFERVLWFYDEWQPLYQNNDINNNLQRIEFRQGVPDINEFDGVKATLIILDDLMREANGSVVDIFTKGSHHRNLSVFNITQNLFYQGKGQRDISLNANYIVYFKNPRDKAQINFLARQIFPENIKFVQESYKDATMRPHGYLLIDLKQNTPDDFRIRTNILPDEEPCYVYIPKKNYKYKSK
ncbi:hypothetical protein TcasGA2_TC005055 [Tribolium castaneum]|uniref:Uncharacterized protein n=1 Tax=Tribolium castaneum TaxID=7070 RepID=D7EL24_TRICA|nr:hypothetical protein TcasGA2_TC005055 [Tribolium castaneum]